MARNGTVVPVPVTEKAKDRPRVNPNRFRRAHVHQRAIDGIDMIAKTLSDRAQAGLNISGVRVELGKAHLWDLAVEHLAKEFGVEL